MSSKPKRPALLDLDSMLVKSSAPVAEASPVIAQAEAKAAPAKPGAPAAEMFRTSVYFPRVVHDKLREIAFEERKTITDLINEGLDHVLSVRNYATTTELRGKR